MYVEVTSKIWEARGKHWAIKAIECIAKVFHKSFCKSVVSYILRSKILDDLLKKPFYQYDIETNTSPDLKTTMWWILKYFEEIIYVIFYYKWSLSMQSYLFEIIISSCCWNWIWLCHYKTSEVNLLIPKNQVFFGFVCRSRPSS